MFIMANYYRVTPVSTKVYFSMILKTFDTKKSYFDMLFLYLYVCSSQSLHPLVIFNVNTVTPGNQQLHLEKRAH